MSEWGEPRSAKRLEKLPRTIAAFATNAKRRPRPPEEAIADWEADLDWLKEQYYRGPYLFNWPSTEVLS